MKHVVGVDRLHRGEIAGPAIANDDLGIAHRALLPAGWRGVPVGAAAAPVGDDGPGARAGLYGVSAAARPRNAAMTRSCAAASR